MENRYQDSKIYKLVCNDGYYYISSTTQELNNRLNNHKSQSKTGVNKVYNYINIIGWDNVIIELIEKYPCNSKKELVDREKYYINNSKLDNLCLNFKDKNMYQNGKIYKLICEDGHYYIGSTTQTLYNRFNHHKEASKNGTSVVYKYINKIGIDKFTIELIENYPCDIKSDLNKREEYYINNSKTDKLCLNIKRAYLSEEDRKENIKKYYEENKEIIIEKHRNYIYQNREKVDAYQAQYRLDNAEKRREYTRQYSLQHSEQVKEAKKEYDKNNKDKIRAYWNEYNNRDENKEKIRQYKKKSAQKIKEKNAEKIAKEQEDKKKIREEKKQSRISYDRIIVKCLCGGSYQNYQKKRHEESIKHHRFVSDTSITE
jgi:group I intron endonuclease